MDDLAFVRFANATSAPGFEYLVRIPTDTAYDDLGIDATASDQEVRWAVDEKKRQLATKRDEFRGRVDDVIAKVPGYKGVLDRVAELKRLNELSHSAESADLEKVLIQMERKALQEDPKFLENRVLCEKLDKEIHQWSERSLDNPDERTKYERKHPPLALLKLWDCGQAQFTERRVAMLLIRREVASFLEGKGERVFHPSDITRTDFHGDYQMNELIDHPQIP